LHAQRRFEAASLQEILVLEELSSGAVCCYLSSMKDDRPFTKVKSHVKIVGGNDLGVVESLQEGNQPAA